MYIIEGNIGAGKSTFIKRIKESLPHLPAAFEPLHNWQAQDYGQSLLASFYTDPKRWAYTMETFTMACRVRDHLAEQAHDRGTHIAERSIYSGHYVFAKNSCENGFISDIEWQIYNEWFLFLTAKKCTLPHGFIYIRTSPEKAFERIQKRSRADEAPISLTYLQQIHAHHEQFLLDKKGISPALARVPVLILEGDEEFETNEMLFSEHLEKIQHFIKATQAALRDAQLPKLVL